MKMVRGFNVLPLHDLRQLGVTRKQGQNRECYLKRYLTPYERPKARPPWPEHYDRRNTSMKASSLSMG